MQGDFQICISVPFKDNYFLEHLRAAASVTLPPTLVEVFFFFFRYHFTKACSFKISLLKKIYVLISTKVKSFIDSNINLLVFFYILTK